MHAEAGDTIYVDVDASEFHSSMVPFVTLLAGDGSTVLVHSREWDGLDPYVVYVAPTSGTYYVLISGLLYAGHGSSAFYTVNLRRTACPIVAAEAEPNDNQALAKDLPLNSSISALSCPSGDNDWYRVAVNAPSKVALQLRTPEQWRPTFGEAVDMTATLTVYTADGSSVTNRWMYMGGADSMRVEWDAPSAGTYFVAVHLYPGGFRWTYTVSASASPPAPGDPITTVAEQHALRNLVTGPTGDMYVAAVDPYRILRISPNGQVQEISRGLFVYDLAFDGFGNLLGIGTLHGTCCTSGEGVVYRIAPNDGRSVPLINDFTFGVAIGVAADNTIWIGDDGQRTLRHYDANGRFLAAHTTSSLQGSGVSHFGVSPAGALYFATDQALYRFDGAPHFVLAVPPPVSGFAFDATGGIFVSNIGMPVDGNGFGGPGRIDRFDRNGNPVSVPFASSLGGALGATFGRNSDGAPNERLFLTQENKLAEVRSGSTGVAGGEPRVVAVCPAGTESEPNNGIATGAPLELGSSRTGATCPAGDADYFALKSGPEAVVELQGEAAAEMTLELLAADGTTRLAFDSGSPTHNPTVYAPAGAKKFVAVRGSFGSARVYTLSAERSVSVARASAAILGDSTLTTDESTSLDGLGNQNGRYDIGDLRLLLMRAGLLASPTKRVSP